jgi:hypothetical protein
MKTPAAQRAPAKMKLGSTGNCLLGYIFMHVIVACVSIATCAGRALRRQFARIPHTLTTAIVAVHVRLRTDKGWDGYLG